MCTTRIQRPELPSCTNKDTSTNRNGRQRYHCHWARRTSRCISRYIEVTHLFCYSQRTVCVFEYSVYECGPRASAPCIPISYYPSTHCTHWSPLVSLPVSPRVTRRPGFTGCTPPEKRLPPIGVSKQLDLSVGRSSIIRDDRCGASGSQNQTKTY